MAVNRGAVKDPDRVVGTLGEFGKLRLDPKSYLSCGEPRDGVARCPFAATCTFAFKGQEGQRDVIAIEFGGRDNGDKVKRDESGKIVTEQRAVGGPRVMAVYRKDTFTQQSKVMFLSCVRYYENLTRRWSFKPSNRPADIVAIIAMEGDGKLIPMRETREVITGTNKNGTPKWACKHVKVPRAVPFYERPDEWMVDRAVDLEIEDLLKERAIQESSAVISGMRPEDRPIEVGANPLEIDLDVVRRTAGEGEG